MFNLSIKGIVWLLSNEVILMESLNIFILLGYQSFILMMGTVILNFSLKGVLHNHKAPTSEAL